MQIFFDTLIIMFLLVPLILLFLLFHHLFYRPQSVWHNHRKKAVALGCALALFYAVISWGSFLEPYFLITDMERIQIGLQEPIRVALLADTQVGPYKRTFFMEKVVRKTLSLNPDIVIFAGDFVMNGNGKTEQELAMLAPLARIAKKVPFYGVLGNHEYGFGEPSLTVQVEDVHRETKEALERLGLEVLVDEEREIEVRGQKIRIVGLDDLWGAHFKVPVVQESDLPTIAATHNPDTVYYLNSEAIDLLLSGHTHGGQIRLPSIGALASANTRLPMRYYKGLSLINSIKLFVSGGAGETGPRARLFNIPEVNLLELY